MKRLNALDCRVLTGNRSIGRRPQFTRQRKRKIFAFFYDEDCLWLDVHRGKYRIGIPFQQIVQMRKEALEDFDKL